MRKIIFGLAVVAMAATTSAFTIGYTSIAPGNIYVNSENNKYDLLESHFDINNCEQAETTACAYRELPEGENIVTTPFSASQAEEWESQGLIEMVSNKSGLYIE